MVWLTSDTSSGPSHEIAASGGKILASSGSDMWPSDDMTMRSACGAWLRPNSTLCESSRRMPPIRSLSGMTSSLNLILYLPSMCGRTSIAWAFAMSSLRYLKTISGSPIAKPSS